MGINRVLGTALPLVLLFLLFSCGGVGVAKRNSLENPRTGASSKERAAEPTTERADTAVDTRIPRSGRSASSIESYFDPWLNAPYLMGGEDFSGVDCSGLVNRFYVDFYEIDVPRSTQSQYDESIAVMDGNEMAGDLVFFKNTYRPGISHVGIYLGENRFVHAANSGVEVITLDDEYYKIRFAGFRRFEK